MIVIEDSSHCETLAGCETFEEAVAALKRLASMPWDQPPNRASCTNWRKCGREYELREFDMTQKPWKLLRRVSVLNVSAEGVQWASGFEEEWAAAR